MELTLHLPASDWYRETPANDLSYWGLDYPPLSAYQSRLHTVLFNASLPAAVALRSSRGFDSPQSKLLMRWTVLSSDLAVFFLAALWFMWAYVRSRVGGGGEEKGEERMWLLAMVLVNPCLVSIDHWDFQYNCISLGLTLGAIAAVLSRNELVTAALFSRAINHKQVLLLHGELLSDDYLAAQIYKAEFPRE